MGIRASSSLTYDARRQGTRCMYASLSRGLTSYRSADIQDVATMNFFSDEDRQEQEDLIDNKTGTKDIDNLYRLQVEDPEETN